ncbi:hypothetical protein [Polaromonas sp. C04]|uniref:hypothetical protein n=1 Tax=Polaromonas sp. C04 TaxID=1945857 RepID=UPI000985882C|nr:hypothetical protein [Polaromonas sp. C04]OOG51605.1 hypothetical protein B0E49_15245 [Polaromonas sp. C04]
MSEVRFAQPGDIPALIELGRQMHVQSRYAWMVFSASRVWTYLENAIPNKQYCVIVATQDAASDAPLCGLLLATAHQYSFANDFMAQIDYLYVLPTKRGTPAAMKMMAGFKRWAGNREVGEISMANRFGANEAYTGKLFGKLDMPAVGGVHAMWVQRK